MQPGAGMQPLMDTDSERLMAEGIRTGIAAFERLLEATDWTREQIDRSICHQVGSRHRAGMLEAMGLNPQRDSITFPKLGNTGSVALPLSLAWAAKSGELSANDRTALLGIGSGINSVMLAAQWQDVSVGGNIELIQSDLLSGKPLL